MKFFIKILLFCVCVFLVIQISNGYLALVHRVFPTWSNKVEFVLSPKCEISTADNVYSLSVDQTSYVGLISAISIKRNLPPRAATIAIATAMQESGIRNLDYGDLDSLGLFQQRPSQGWGTPEEIMDPVYSINAFYDELIKIPNYATKDINDPAQLVQRSNHPTLYRQHEPIARQFASTLTGHSGGNMSCKAKPLSVDLKIYEVISDMGRLEKDIENFFSPLNIISNIDDSKITIVSSDDIQSWSVVNWLISQNMSYAVEEIYYKTYYWERNLGISKNESNQQNMGEAVVIKFANARI